jgi:polysaccharide deacetylase family protein (PEP-CTERM system associated)
MPGAHTDTRTAELPRAIPGDVLSRKRHVLTIALEDYYHGSPLKGLVDRSQWSRFERRLEVGTDRALALLEEAGISATFFVLGWVAEQMPELVQKVAAHGHEVASKGYFHKSIREMSPPEFRDDLLRAQESIGAASGRAVIGYRVARRWFDPADLWALEILADSGYLYDSSVKPVFRAYAREPWRRFAHQHQTSSRTIWEYPPSSIGLFGFDMPIAGGNYLRQLPPAFFRRAVARWDRLYEAPYVMYFHTWELDPDQPRIHAAPLLQRIRLYRNLERMEARLREYLTRYRFTSISQHLGIEAAHEPRTERPEMEVVLSASVRAPHRPKPEARGTRERSAPAVSVVVPCYNEETTLPYLSNVLDQVANKLSDRYALHLIFVNDGSTDQTGAVLDHLFGHRPDCRIIHHPENRGISSAILTGIRCAHTEVVCSIDCDCTYDPGQLGEMIPLLTQGVDLVTASPYHSLGQVRNVPAWRLWISRAASRFYRIVLHHKLHTYTSCFRVYRRAAILELPLSETGFLGITELLGRLDLRGGRIVEHPAVLEGRMLGRSKMKVLATSLGHVRLLGDLLRERMLSENGFSHRNGSRS